MNCKSCTNGLTKDEEPFEQCKMCMDEEGMTWGEIESEFDYIENMCLENFRKNKETNECSIHFITHYDVAGACPLCLLHTFIKEKQRIGE